jgi:hypothetical protein
VTLNPKPVQYKGDDLDPERGPGLGCFRFQLIVLGIFIVLTPLSVVWQWPDGVSAALLFAVLILLLVTGQTIIFLLRLTAADRRGRRRPLGSATKTVGELEDAAAATTAMDASDADTAAEETPADPIGPPFNYLCPRQQAGARAHCATQAGTSVPGQNRSHGQGLHA